jgi:hypothetical protein
MRLDPVIGMFSEPDFFPDARLFLVACWFGRRGADGNEYGGYLHHVEISQPTAPSSVHPRHWRSTETSSVDIYLSKRTCVVYFVPQMFGRDFDFRSESCQRRTHDQKE